MLGQRLAGRLVGDLGHDGDRDVLAGERLDDHGGGREAGLVGHEQVGVGAGGRGVRLARAPQRHRVAGLRPVRPARRRAVVAVEHEQQVDLGDVGSPAAQRVVGADRALLLGHLLVAGPRERLVDRELVTALGREQDVEERVGAERAEGGQVAAADGDLPQVRVDLLHPDHGREEGPDGVHLGHHELGTGQAVLTRLLPGERHEGERLRAGLPDVGELGRELDPGRHLAFGDGQDELQPGAVVGGEHGGGRIPAITEDAADQEHRVGVAVVEEDDRLGGLRSDRGVEVVGGLAGRVGRVGHVSVLR